MAADTFGTFLDSLNRETQRMRDVPGAQDVKGASDQLFASIAKVGRLNATDLIESSGLGVARFSDALRTLRDAGLVTVESDAGETVLELTSGGAEIAQMTR